jgi:hypothetical protein
MFCQRLKILLKSAGMKNTSNVIYLGYGLLIGAALSLLTLAALVALRSNTIVLALVAPESSPTLAPLPSLAPSPTLPPTITFIPPPVLILPPTFTPTFTPTPTLFGLNATPTDTPPPSPTLTLSEEKLLNGELAIVGPLTKEQQTLLYETSLRYVALTTAESTMLGEQFAGAGYGSPSLICGPLSISILQTAGLMRVDSLVPHDFWLLNPFLPKDRALANYAFPPARYEHHEIIKSIREITFSTFPLYPGDFLYLKHGSGGTFDHMLVVNRVDSLGRAYSVTNYDTDQGFIINEVMLYDPNDPTAGIFMEWTAQRRSLKGATGFGGFELWRLRTP